MAKLTPEQIKEAEDEYNRKNWFAHGRTWDPHGSFYGRQGGFGQPAAGGEVDIQIAGDENDARIGNSIREKRQQAANNNNTARLTKLGMSKDEALAYMIKAALEGQTTEKVDEDLDTWEQPVDDEGKPKEDITPITTDIKTGAKYGGKLAGPFGYIAGGLGGAAYHGGEHFMNAYGRNATEDETLAAIMDRGDGGFADHYVDPEYHNRNDKDYEEGNKNAHDYWEQRNLSGEGTPQSTRDQNPGELSSPNPGGYDTSSWDEYFKKLNAGLRQQSTNDYASLSDVKRANESGLSTPEKDVTESFEPRAGETTEEAKQKKKMLASLLAALVG
jgi:hypothetical protein